MAAGIERHLWSVFQIAEPVRLMTPDDIIDLATEVACWADLAAAASALCRAVENNTSDPREAIAVAAQRWMKLDEYSFGDAVTAVLVGAAARYAGP